MNTITIDNITIEVQRKKIKRMNLRIIPPHGTVKISAPFRTSDAMIYRFAVENMSWILKKQATLKNMDFPQIPSLNKLSLKTYRTQLQARVDTLLPYWEEKIGESVSQCQIRVMKSRWGTCYPDKRKICLNLMLVHYPIVCLEYVIVHELVHLIEASHNARFKALMDKFMPDWRQCKQMLI